MLLHNCKVKKTTNIALRLTADTCQPHGNGVSYAREIYLTKTDGLYTDGFALLFGCATSWFKKHKNTLKHSFVAMAICSHGHDRQF